MTTKADPRVTPTDWKVASARGAADGLPPLPRTRQAPQTRPPRWSPGARLVAALLACAALTAQAQEGLGRLFHTPPQRDDLDRRRASNIQERASVTQDVRILLNGHVSRSGGRSTTWINGLPQNDLAHPRDPSRVPLPVGENDAAVTLRVGESLDRGSGQIRDELRGGQVSVPDQHRSPQARQAPRPSPQSPQSPQSTQPTKSRPQPQPAPPAAR